MGDQRGGNQVRAKMKKYEWETKAAAVLRQKRDFMEAESALRRYELDRLHLKRGDTLVVSVPELRLVMSTEMGRERGEIFKQYFIKDVPPGVGVLLIDREEKLSLDTQWYKEAREKALE
jgi:hypothetical protein